jgi:transposase
MAALWAEVQTLKARLAALEATPDEPRQDAHHASMPPSRTLQVHRAPSPRLGARREARGGRAGGGRPRHPEPDHVMIAQAQSGPHGGGAVPAPEPHVHAVSDTIEWPPLTPIVTRVAPQGEQCPHGGPLSGAPVPVGMEPGPPVGASIERLAISLRSTHASSDARLSALCRQGCGGSSREGARATLFPRVNTRRDDRVGEMLTRLRSRRLVGRDDTGARVNGRTPWDWVFQHAEGCGQVRRPRRGHGVIHELLGDPRPTLWGSARSRAPQHHPAEPWQVCWAPP